MQYFLIVGNGRTGSTWLESSFDRLSDVRARREIKWRLPYQTDHPMHRYIGPATRSIKEVLPPPEDGTDSVRAVGSKLIFDPYGYLSRSVFDHLNRIIEDDVRLIHIRRPYAEIFRSWKLRGVAHALNERALAYANIDPVLVDAISEPDSEGVKVDRMVLTAGGAPLAGGKAAAASPDCIHYPLEDAIDDLLVYFHNDVATAPMLARRRAAAVAYAEIAGRFPELARFVGSRASDSETADVMAAPTTGRLERLDETLVEPAGVIERFSDCLERAFRESISAEVPGAEPWILHEAEGTATIRISGLADLLAAYGIAADPGEPPPTGKPAVGGDPPPRPVYWKLRKPVYAL